MTQLFRPAADTAFRLGILAAVLAVIIVLGGAFVYVRSDLFWRVGKGAEQPIPFRHDLHASGLGIACAFCHSTAQRAAHAGMPSAETCLTCHSQILQGASVLEPLRTSVALGQTVRWASVHRLPSFVYFHHGIHVSKGVSCETCHGQVDRMRQTHKVNTLSMGWCLDCHRNPEPYGSSPISKASEQARVEARSEPPRKSEALKISEVFANPLTNCSVCHR